MLNTFVFLGEFFYMRVWCEVGEERTLFVIPLTSLMYLSRNAFDDDCVGLLLITNGMLRMALT